MVSPSVVQETLPFFILERVKWMEPCGNVIVAQRVAGSLAAALITSGNVLVVILSPLEPVVVVQAANNIATIGMPKS